MNRPIWVGTVWMSIICRPLNPLTLARYLPTLAQIPFGGLWFSFSFLFPLPFLSLRGGGSTYWLNLYWVWFKFEFKPLFLSPFLPIFLDISLSHLPRPDDALNDWVIGHFVETRIGSVEHQCKIKNGTRYGVGCCKDFQECGKEDASDSTGSCLILSLPPQSRPSRVLKLIRCYHCPTWIHGQSSATIYLIAPRNWCYRAPPSPPPLKILYAPQTTYSI